MNKILSGVVIILAAVVVAFWWSSVNKTETKDASPTATYDGNNTDINFDGHPDKVEGDGKSYAGGNIVYQVSLFDPKTGKYVANEAFSWALSGIQDYSLHPESKTIVVTGKSSVSELFKMTYEVTGHSSLTLIKEERLDLTREGSDFEIVTE